MGAVKVSLGPQPRGVSPCLGKLEHAKLLQSALNGRMKGHTVPQQMSPPGGAPTYCWNDECSSGVEGESYYGTSLLQLGENGRPYCHNCIAENPTLVEPPNAGSMIKAQYKLAWMLPDGVTERFDDTQQRGWQPVWHAVHKRRFLTPAFNMSNGRLPSSIRAILRSKFPNANL